MKPLRIIMASICFLAILMAEKNSQAQVSTEKKQISSKKSPDELKVERQLLTIDTAIKTHKIILAKKVISEILNRKDQNFESQRIADYVKGTALYMQGEIFHIEDKNNLAATQAFKKSLLRGNPQAANKLALLTNPDDAEDSVRYEKELQYYSIASELADTNAMYKTQILLGYFQRSHEKFYYWGYISNMGKDPASLVELNKTYQEGADSDKRLFARVMKNYAIDGGSVRSNIQGLPGRSVPTSAYVELGMRVALKNYWWQVFNPVDNGARNTLKSAYEGLRDIVKKNNPTCATYLLVNKNFKSTEKHFSFNSEKLLDIILPGDQVFVNCGVLSHFAIVWKVDKQNKKLYFLDPYFEFWRPGINTCVTDFQMVPYKYNRYLAELSSDEVQKMIIGIITIRDAMH